MRTALTWRPSRNGWDIVRLLQLPILTPILISAKKFNLLKQLWGIIPHRPSKSGRDDLEGCSFIKNKKDLSNPRNKPFYKCRRPESNQNTFLKPLKRKEILRIPPKSVQKVFNACSTTFPIFLSYKNKNLKQSYKISSHILYFTENKNAINYYS